ncbi:hypothetical protein [Shewanella colwelliana]|nr:hypothetical protein [Shewanella colwelliana]
MSEVFDFLSKNGALLISVFAIFVAMQANSTSRKNTLIAQKALDIANTDAEEKREKIESYIKDSAKWTDEEFYYFAFFIEYKNKSSIKNTLSDITISICFQKEDLSDFVITSNPVSLCNVPEKWKGRNEYGAQIAIEEKSAVEGVIYAKVARSVVGEKFIQSVATLAKCINGDEIEARSYSLRDHYV